MVVKDLFTETDTIRKKDGDCRERAEGLESSNDPLVHSLVQRIDDKKDMQTACEHGSPTYEHLFVRETAACPRSSARFGENFHARWVVECKLAEDRREQGCKVSRSRVVGRIKEVDEGNEIGATRCAVGLQLSNRGGAGRQDQQTDNSRNGLQLTLWYFYRNQLLVDEKEKGDGEQGETHHSRTASVLGSFSP